MKNWTRIAALAVAGWALPTLALAQSAQEIQDRRAVEAATAQGGGRGGRVILGVETRVTPNRPYAADAVTESLQVLGDGNRIAKRSVTRVYRDNEGRTRREQLDDNGLPRTITINDPIAGHGYTLNPSTKTATQSNVMALRSPTIAGSGSSARGGGRGGAVAATAAPTEEARRRAEQMTAARVEMSETSRVASGEMRQVLERAASGGGTSTREDLGEQLIEGVRATGTRTTTVIPAGSSIGNQNEIRIVAEQWFSPDLEVLVLTKHTDPRVGETVYKLTNIVRGQPDPNLFSVPGDYTIKSRSVRN